MVSNLPYKTSKIIYRYPATILSSLVLVQSRCKFMLKEVYNMTKNQLEYLKLRETQRSNLAQESLTRQRDANTYSIGLGNLNELKRHNIATEQHNTRVLGETYRHNVTTENLNLQSLNESRRHNKVQESIAQQQADTQKFNAVETQRHNIVGEYLTQQDVDTRKYNAYESHRHNVASENETYRSNVARESENYRHNVTQEREAQRHNVAGEIVARGQLSLGRQNLAETTRHNIAAETELNRHNVETETVSFYNAYEDHRHNKASESENARHNIAEEEVKTYDAKTRRNKQWTDTILGAYDAIIGTQKTYFDMFAKTVDSGAKVLDLLND